MSGNDNEQKLSLACKKIINVVSVLPFTFFWKLGLKYKQSAEGHMMHTSSLYNLIAL